MNKIIKLDVENDILIVRHYYMNDYDEIRVYSFSSVINGINNNIPYETITQEKLNTMIV